MTSGSGLGRWRRDREAPIVFWVVRLCTAECLWGGEECLDKGPNFRFEDAFHFRFLVLYFDFNTALYLEVEHTRYDSIHKT